MSKYISTADLANVHGVTVQAVNRWRLKAEQKAERVFGIRSEQDARVIVFSEQEVVLILECAPTVMAKQASPTPIEAEVVDAGEVTALVPLTQTQPQAALIRHFNRSGVDQDIEAMKLIGQRGAQQANDALVGFARARLQQAAARIDATVQAAEANAMAAVGMEANDAVIGD